MVSRSPPDARRTHGVSPGVWPPVRRTITLDATSDSFSNDRAFPDTCHGVPS
jgi:hypothetical protein